MRALPSRPREGLGERAPHPLHSHRREGPRIDPIESDPDLTDARVRAVPFPSDATWLNTEQPLRLDAELQGHVVVLDFWTYCCINCLHVLPVLSRLEQHFAEEPVAVIGVHSAKFLTEKDPQHIRRALQRLHVQHPVVVDSDQKLWQQYAVRAWPTLVLIDAEGTVREQISGEIDEATLRAKIQALLEEGRDLDRLAPLPFDHRPDPSADEHTLFYPGKVEADERFLYIADSGHHRLLVTDHHGRVQRVVGGERGVGLADGRFDTCAFNDPQGMSSNGTRLYIADRGNHALRALDLDLFWVETLAGTGECGRSRGAQDPSRPREIALRSPWDVQQVGDHVLIAMAGSHQIWLWDEQEKAIGAWAGTGAEGHADGPLQEAAFAQPSGLCLAGPWVMVADAEISSVRAIDLQQGEVQTVVGRGLFDFGDVDGEGDDVLLQHPMDVALLGETLYVADTYNHKIKAIDLRSRRTQTVFGGGEEALLDEPAGLCAVGERLLVADTNHHRVLWADPTDGSLTPLELTGL